MFQVSEMGQWSSFTAPRLNGLSTEHC